MCFVDSSRVFYTCQEYDVISGVGLTGISSYVPSDALTIVHREKTREFLVRVKV